MKTKLRYASHPDDAKSYDTKRLREEFLIEDVFIGDEIALVYSLYDRYIVGGAMPVSRELPLESADELKAINFLDRREMGIINVGGPAEISAGDQLYKIGFKEAI
jgi:4-deoxy-L-threo-5-hexosulose-uronate ketol-isomerase